MLLIFHVQDEDLGGLFTAGSLGLTEERLGGFGCRPGQHQGGGLFI